MATDEDLRKPIEANGEEDMDIDDEDKDEESIDESNVKNNFDKLQFNYISLKQILLSKDVICYLNSLLQANIPDEIADKITVSFFTNYFLNTNLTYQDLLEDRVIFVVLSKIKKLLVDDKSTKNFKVCLSLLYFRL